MQSCKPKVLYCVALLLIYAVYTTFNIPVVTEFAFLYS